MKNNQPPQAAHHANHDSVTPRQHPLICTGAEPIHQVHGSPKLELWSRCSEIGSHFHHFPAVFFVKTEFWELGTLRLRVIGPCMSRRETKIDVWKYMRPTLIGFGAVLEEKLNNQESRTVHFALKRLSRPTRCAASGGTLAPQPRHVTRHQPETIQTNILLVKCGSQPRVNSSLSTPHHTSKKYFQVFGSTNQIEPVRACKSL